MTYSNKDLRAGRAQHCGRVVAPGPLQRAELDNTCVLEGCEFLGAPPSGRTMALPWTCGQKSGSAEEPPPLSPLQSPFLKSGPCGFKPSLGQKTAQLPEDRRGAIPAVKWIREEEKGLQRLPKHPVFFCAKSTNA